VARIPVNPPGTRDPMPVGDDSLAIGQLAFTPSGRYPTARTVRP
jgi:hypothetical protein